jgi:hypothetical protein
VPSRTITGDDFARAAARQIGKPYEWGGSSPKSGFDCSGLVEYELTSLGLSNVPRTSEAQYAWTRRVPPSELQAGDLVFLNFPGETSPGHVMIYAGGKRVIQAPKTGELVQEDVFNPQKPGSNEWGATVVGYGRVPGLSYAGEPAGVASTPVVVGGNPVTRGRGRPASGQPPAGVKGPVGESSSGGGGGSGGILGFFEGTGSDIGSAAGWVGSGASSAAGDVSGGVASAWNDITGAILGPLDFLRAALWLVNPVNWLRAFEAIVGLVLILLSVGIAVGADKALREVGADTAAAAATGE